MAPGGSSRTQHMVLRGGLNPPVRSCGLRLWVAIVGCSGHRTQQPRHHDGVGRDPARQLCRTLGIARGVGGRFACGRGHRRSYRHLFFVFMAVLMIGFQVQKLLSFVAAERRDSSEGQIVLVVGWPWCLAISLIALLLYETGRFSTQVRATGCRSLRCEPRRSGTPPGAPRPRWGREHQPARRCGWHGSRRRG